MANFVAELRQAVHERHRLLLEDQGERLVFIGTNCLILGPLQRRSVRALVDPGQAATRTLANQVVDVYDTL